MSNMFYHLKKICNVITFDKNLLEEDIQILYHMNVLKK